MKTTLLFLVIVAVLACAQGPAGAQQSAKVPQIGYLNTPVRQSGSLPANRPGRYLSEPFLQGMRELGYVEGQNVIVTFRIGEVAQFPDLATDLVQRKVDVIVAQTPAAISAAMKATKTIPIVMNSPADPVLLGFVASLERPGGNVTGMSGLTTELGGKWLELLKETIPSAKRVAVFWNWRAEDTLPTWKNVVLAARSLKVDLDWLEVRGPLDIERAFRRASFRPPDAFIVLPGFGVRGNLTKIAELALKHRLPGIFWRTDIDLDRMKGLMAYGSNRYEQSRRAAYVVDKILKGAKPGDLPVERPTQFELVINLKTAKEIGVTIPPDVLMWADRVIK